MKIYSLRATQKLPISVNEAWLFLSDPKNLKVITPDFLGFQIISGADIPMYAGQIIEYTVSPLMGVKLNWITEITHMVENKYFVDEQRFGPYAFWHHQHFLREIDGGVEMEDLLHYKLPFGIIGQMAHSTMVKPKIEEIFQYRKNKLIELFGEY